MAYADTHGAPAGKHPSPHRALAIPNWPGLTLSVALHTFVRSCHSVADMYLAVKAAMGHSHITTTERYLHARPTGELADRFTSALGGASVSAAA